MFRNDAQACEAITLMLANAGLDELWTPAGPTDRACSLREQGGGPMSHGEALMLKVAFDFWNGHGHADFGELIATLDGTNLGAVASLATAFAHGEVAAWIENERKELGWTSPTSPQP